MASDTQVTQETQREGLKRQALKKLAMQKLQGGNVNVMRESTGDVISAPASLSAGAIEYSDDVQNQGKKSGNYMGFQALRGLASFPAATPQIAASSFIREADLFKETFDGEFGIADLGNILNPLTTMQSGSKRGSIANLQSALGFETDDNVLQNENLLKAGQDLLSSNKKFLKESRLVKEEGDGFSFDIGSGFGSVATSIGLTFLSKNPFLATGLFAESQRSQAYVEAREKGWDADDARAVADVMGIAEGAIEYIGGKVFLDAVGVDKAIKRIILRSTNEAAQEAAQTGAEEIITQTSGLREKDAQGALERVAYSAAIGFIVSAPINTVVTRAENRAKELGLSEEGAKAFAQSLESNQAEIKKAGEDILVNEASLVAKDEKAQAETAQVIQKYVSGEDISLPESQVDEKLEGLDAIQGKGILPVPKRVETIGDFLIKSGGLNLSDETMSGELRTLTKKENPELKGVAKKTGKLKLEQALEMAVEEGFIAAPDPNNPTDIDVNTLIEAIQNQDVRESDIGAGLDRDQVLEFNAQQDEVNQEIISRTKGFDTVRQAFRTGVTAAKKDVKAVQTSIIKALDEAKLRPEDKAKFIKKIKNTQTNKQLKKALPDIEEKVLDLLDAQFLREQKTKLSRELSSKSIKPKTQSGKKVGKFDPDTQVRLDELLALSKITGRYKPKGSSIVTNNALDELNKRIAEGLNDVLANMILNIKANPSDVTATDIATIRSEIKSIKSLGLAKAEQRLGTVKAQAKEIKDRYINLIGQERLKKANSLKDIFGNINNYFLAGSGAWRQKLKYTISSSNKDLSENFLRDVSLTDEASAHEMGKISVFNDFVKTTIENTGFKNEKQLLKYMQKTQGDIVLDKVFTFSDGVQRRLTMTRSEVRKRLLEFADTDLRESMMHKKSNAYTENIISEIEQSVDEIDYQLVQAELKFYDKYYSRINDTYKKRYGINLPKIEFYSPIRREFADGETDEFLQGIMYRGGVAPNSLKSRTPNIRPIKQQGDFEVLYSHVQEMEYFIAYSEKVDILNKAIKSDSVQRLLQNKYGDMVLKTINKDLDSFSKKNLVSAETGEKIVRTLARNFSASQLALKPQIGLKQLTSMFAYAGDVKTVDFMEGIAAFASNPKKALGILNETSTFKNRGMSIDKDYADLISDKSALNILGKNPNFTKAMFVFIRYGDKGAIGVGGYAYYHSLRKAGKSHAEALAAFERKTNDTQQSTNPDQLSELQRSNGFVRILTQFMSSPNALARAEYEAILDLASGRNTKSEFVKKIFIFHFLIPNVFQLVANGFTWDDEDQLRASVLGAFNGILVFGDILEAVASYGISGEFFEPEIRHPADFVTSILRSIGQFDMNEITIDDFIDGIKSVETALDGTGKLLGLPLRTLYNDLIGAVDITEGDYGTGVPLMLGYSPWIVENKMNKKNESPRRVSRTRRRFRSSSRSRNRRDNN